MHQRSNDAKFDAHWQQEKFQPPVDSHNITGQFNPEVHSLTGMVPISVSGFQHPSVDRFTLAVAQQLAGSGFKFNMDMNSGMPLGVGSYTCSPIYSQYISNLVMSCTNG